MKFRLSSLLVFVTLFAFAVGLGYQMILLRSDLAKVRTELQKLKQGPFTVTIAPPRQPNPLNQPFRLLNGTLIDPATERGMKSDELERKERLRRELDKRNHIIPVIPMPTPEKFDPGLGDRSL